MGDMADFTNEQIEVNIEMRDMYRRGDMTTRAAYENGIVDEMGCETEQNTYKTCRCCKATGLVWGLHNNKYRLFNGDELHHCPVNPLT